ncbi:HNH endonuclease signature motif containing protein [Deinococcus apachensis]|uniref:HNH endonuclease signature motif containing protein n=1 Tax=Deinococcus apachensis TaxID=309886 RepID=UPI000A063314
MRLPAHEIPALTELDKTRFQEKVKKTQTCWIWTGAHDSHKPTPYGVCRIRQKLYKAHRIALVLAGRNIPTDMVVDHVCRNTLCVNPDHLDVVTAGVNTLRGIGTGARNARKTHCKHGHPFTEKNTYFNGKQRICLECRRARGREKEMRRRLKAKLG